MALYDTPLNSAPWNFDFGVTSQLVDLNDTDARNHNGDVSLKKLTYTNNNAFPNLAINTTDAAFVPQEFFTDSASAVPFAASTTDTLTAAGHGNVGAQDFTVTFAAADIDYIGSVNSTTDADVPNFEISKHHTRTNILDIEDVDFTDFEDPSVPWDHPFDVTIKLLDLNDTLARNHNGDVSGKILTYSNNSMAVGMQAINSDETTVVSTDGPGPLPAMAQTIDELTAAGVGNVGIQEFTVTFAVGDIDYLGSINSTTDILVPDFNITKHHSKLTANNIPDVPRSQTITATGFLIDLNRTAISASFSGSGNVTGKLIEISTLCPDCTTAIPQFDNVLTEGVVFNNTTGTSLKVLECTERRFFGVSGFHFT